MTAFKKRCAACDEILAVSAYERFETGKIDSVCKKCRRNGVTSKIVDGWPAMPEILNPQYWRQYEHKMP